MPATLSRPKRSFALFVCTLAGAAFAIRHYGEVASLSSRDTANKLFVIPTNRSKEHIGVNGVFFKRLWRLLKIIVPGPLSVEAGYLLSAAALMVVRTYCDLWVIRVSTTIESSIIAGRTRDFLGNLSTFILGSIPLALVNNLLKYSLTEMQMRFRTRLTQHLYKEYLRGYTFYKISNMDSRIANPDQLLTQDVEKFCRSVGELYSNMCKPILDMGLYTFMLTRTIGFQGPSRMLGYLAISGLLLTWLRRPIGRFTVMEQKLEGEYRFVNSRLITHSEEVAFYQGNIRERGVIRQTFDRLMSLLRTSQQFRYAMGIVDSVVAKYFATVVGFWVVSRPFLGRTGIAARTQSRERTTIEYYRQARMLMHLAQAVGRLVLAGREMTRLAGFTARVTELMTVLSDLNNGKYMRTMVAKSKPEIKAAGAKDREGKTAESKASEPDSDGAAGKPSAKAALKKQASAVPERKLVSQMQGKVLEKDRLIRFENVPLATPNGDVLIKSMNFEVKSGMNVLVCGPNGCGKSSLFRVLGGLWPLFGGTLVKPARSKLFYIPQKPYLALGTLRDQIIYPDTVEDMKARGKTDDDLSSLLEEVRLEYLTDRKDGYDAVQDWKDVLSGGEKQRVAMARLFYHRPQFAIMDECTSAVSEDVEDYMYEQCRVLNITLFTVSHRKTLWKHHEHILEFDGRGSYVFREKTSADDARAAEMAPVLAAQ